MSNRKRGGTKYEVQAAGRAGAGPDRRARGDHGLGHRAPDTAKEKPQTAEVVAVGQFENGVKVSEGDVIVFAKYSGTEISLDGEDYMILDADDILGVVES